MNRGWELFLMQRLYGTIFTTLFRAQHFMIPLPDLAFYLGRPFICFYIGTYNITFHFSNGDAGS